MTRKLQYDDVLAVNKKKKTLKMEDWTKLLNEQDPAIKFTTETQTDDYLPYINKSNKLDFGINRKNN